MTAHRKHHIMMPTTRKSPSSTYNNDDDGTVHPPTSKRQCRAQSSLERELERVNALLNDSENKLKETLQRHQGTKIHFADVMERELQRAKEETDVLKAALNEEKQAHEELKSRHGVLCSAMKDAETERDNAKELMDITREGAYNDMKAYRTLVGDVDGAIKTLERVVRAFGSDEILKPVRDEMRAIAQTLNKQDLCIVCLSLLASCTVCDTPGCRACVCGECLATKSKTKEMKCFRCNTATTTKRSQEGVHGEQQEEEERDEGNDGSGGGGGGEEDDVHIESSSEEDDDDVEEVSTGSSEEEEEEDEEEEDEEDEEEEEENNDSGFWQRVRVR